MSYQLQLAAVPTPDADLDVFSFMNKLRQDAGTQPPSALLKRFHDALLALFPDAPWSEGHYAGEAGRLTLVHRSTEVVPHVLYLAAELGLTVIDNKSGEVHRPPTYQVVLEGPAHGLEVIDAASRLAALLRKPVAETVALLSGGRRTVVKQGVSRFQAMQYAAALRDRGGSRATLAAEPGPIPRVKPPAPAPAQAAAATPHLEIPAASPYRSPSATLEMVEESAQEDVQLYEVAEGLRIVCSSIGLSFLSGAMTRNATAPVAFIGTLLLGVMSVYGTWRLMKGLGFGALARKAALLLPLATLAAAFALPFYPHTSLAALVGLLALANFVLVLVLGVKGARRLKQAGIGVGLFGASKADVRRLGGLDDGARLLSTTMAWACFIVVVLCNAASLTQKAPARTAAASEASVPCRFVGLWEYTKGGRTFNVYLSDDGSYAGLTANGHSTGQPEFGGTWRYDGKAIHWNDMLASPARQEAQAVSASGDGTFSLLEANGEATSFSLVQRDQSPRCGGPARP
ncbi:hypothetical protein ABT364_15580 [Massilia sp. SR12]